MDDNEELTYPIPQNVTGSYEFFPGVGFFELIVTGVVLLIGLSCTFIILRVIPFILGIVLMVAFVVVTAAVSKFSKFFTITALISAVLVCAGAFLKAPLYIAMIPSIIPPILTLNYVKRDPIQNFSMYQHGKIKRKYKTSQKFYPFGREVKD